MIKSHVQRIAWLSPYSEKSSIGEFSHTLIEKAVSSRKLRDKFEVTVFSNGYGRDFPTNVPIYNLGRTVGVEDVNALLTQHYDSVVFNFGNNVENHGKIFEVFNRVGGVGIFHDVVYQHYFANYFFEQMQSPEAYAYFTGLYYGERALDLLYASSIYSKKRGAKFGLWDSGFSAEFPLIEILLDNKNLNGAVVHSEYALEAINRYKGPKLLLRLPGDEKESLSERQLAMWKERTLSQGSKRVRLCAFGHIQRSKCIDFILSVVAASDRLRSRVELTIAGKPSDSIYVEELKTQIRNFGLESIVTVELNVSAKRLMTIKDEADIFINIRFPNTEGGSGSLIEQLACGKPTIAADSGCFKECKRGVILISMPLVASELEEKLWELVSSPELRIAQGHRALSFARSLDSEKYFSRLLEFLNDVGCERPKARVRISNLSEVADYDSSVRSPAVLTKYSMGQFISFLSLLLDEPKSSHCFRYFLGRYEKDLLGGLNLYQLIRSAMTVDQTEERRRWLLPDILPIEYFIFASCASEDVFRQLFFAALHEGQLKAFEDGYKTFTGRIDTSGPLSKAAFLLLVVNLLPVTDAKRLYEYLSIGAVERSAMDLVRELLSMDKSEFNNLIRTLGKEHFCSSSYLGAYADVADSIRFDRDKHGAAYSHFSRNGFREGREARLSSSGLERLLLDIHAKSSK